jgi:beta-lactamase class A
MTRAPAHAGRLRPSEQVVFALVFALMAAFVVAVTASSARQLAQGSLFSGPSPAASLPASAAAPPRSDAGGGHSHGTGSAATGAGGSAGQAGTAGVGVVMKPVSARLNAQLALAARKALAVHGGRVAVGVLDLTSGQQAEFRAGRRFRAATVVMTDILAALLLRHRQDKTALTVGQASLATAMVDAGSTGAASDLWRAIGTGNGVASVNRLLNLRRTVPGAGDLWGRTKTTVADQLQLLTDLISARSPLTSADRDYMLGLMAGVAAGDRWGVLSAAASGSSYAAMDGWTRDGRRFDVDSIGVVTHGGHVLLIAVLSAQNRSAAAGMALTSAAAVAAATVVTRAAG